MNVAKFLRTTFLAEQIPWLLLWICSWNNFNFKFKYPGESLKARCLKCIWPESWILFLALNNNHFPRAIIISLERVWEIMRYPQYYLAHYPSISSNVSNATDFRKPPTPLTLAHQPPYPRWHNTHVTHAGASLTLAGQPHNPSSLLFFERFQCSTVNLKWGCFSSLHGASCSVLISHLPILTILERKAVRKGKGLGFGLFLF